MSWQWKSNSAQALTKVETATQAGLDDGIDLIFDESQSNVPEDEGNLKASGHIVTEGFTRRIVYDDEAAAIVHEDMSAFHDDGRSKFLESALNARRQDAAAAIARRIRGELT